MIFMSGARRDQAGNYISKRTAGSSVNLFLCSRKTSLSKTWLLQCSMPMEMVTLIFYVVSGGSEFAAGSNLYQDRLYLTMQRWVSRTEFPKTKSSGSCVVPFDADGDGDIDLFRGGQVVAGNYPRPAESYVFVNESGKYADKPARSLPYFLPGKVNSAAAVDLNGDKKPELVVVGEWMPVIVYEFKDAR